MSRAEVNDCIGCITACAISIQCRIEASLAAAPPAMLPVKHKGSGSCFESSMGQEEEQNTTNG